MTGCFHGCEYCYARSIANRFGGYWDDMTLRRRGANGGIHEIDARMTRHTTGKNRGTGVHDVVAPYPYCFDPTFHRYRLDEPQKWKSPRTIFVCSMADLFGSWVPDEWVEQVFDACKQAPEHRYLFLTKNPSRYLDLAYAGKLPTGNAFWYGSTVTDAETQAFYSDEHKTFVSIEPILKPITRDQLTGKLAEKVDWAIFGAETGNRKDKVVPERWWVEDVVAEFQKNGKPVFMKDSMKPIWGEKIITQFPLDY